LPAFLLSRLAGASAWPYALLAWAIHLLTAFLLERLVSSLSNRETGFAAAALYAVLPTANQVLFWSLATSFYYMQSLGLAWFLLHPRLRYLPAVLFLGEQAIPALLLLPASRTSMWRRWAVAAALLAGYALLINRMPVRGSLEQRAGGVEWSLWPLLPRILDTLWRPEWQWHPLLIVAVVPVLAVLLYRPPSSSVVARRPHLNLLFWSLAGVLLTYLPISWLALEWRYLYVPTLFLASGAAALLGLVHSRIRAVLLAIAAAYCVCITFQEMRQCWIPQSRVARALIRALVAGGPYHGGDIVLFSGGPGALGPAPNFITQAGFALRSAVARYSPNPGIRAARELVITASGEAAWYPDVAFGPPSHADLNRLHIFAWRPGDRYEPLSWIALDGLRPLGPNPGPATADRVYTPHRMR
jgi:hypothetical protein